MSISHRIHKQICIFTIGDNLTKDYASTAERYIDDVLDDESISRIVVNCEKVTFLDSSGLGVIIGILNTLQERQGKLALCECIDSVDEIFRLAKLTDVLSIFTTEAEALEAI